MASDPHNRSNRPAVDDDDDPVNNLDLMNLAFKYAIDLMNS
jgi:hypothetical protein